MGILTFKRIPGVGAPRFRVMAGARDLGTISNPGRGSDGGTWCGLAPDGIRFAATSKAKIAEHLQTHAREGLRSTTQHQRLLVSLSEDAGK